MAGQSEHPRQEPSAPRAGASRGAKRTRTKYPAYQHAPTNERTNERIRVTRDTDGLAPSDNSEQTHTPIHHQTPPEHSVTRPRR